MIRTITLTDSGVDSGPFYQVYQSTDGITYTLVQTVTLAGIGSSVDVTIIDTAIAVKLVNINSICGNSVIHQVTGTLGDFSLDFSQLDFN